MGVIPSIIKGTSVSSWYGPTGVRKGEEFQRSTVVQITTLNVNDMKTQMKDRD